MRMSDCHREFRPSRCPTDGMIKAVAGGTEAGCGVTGVTRLIDTGAEMVVTPLVLTVPVPGVTTSRMTVPVNVPLGRPVGSANTVNVSPSGGSSPLAGSTLTSHGLLSSVAVKGSVCPGNPSMWTWMPTSCVLPTGTGTLGLVSVVVTVTGTTTMRAVAE